MIRELALFTKSNFPWPKHLASVVSRGAIGGVSILYGINIILGFIRDSTLASSFGATETLDAYLIGTNFIRTNAMVIATAIASALVPVYARILESNGDQRWQRLTSHLFRQVFILFALYALIISAISSRLTYFLGPGLSVNGQYTLQSTLLTLVPLLVVFPLSSIIKSLADSSGDFAVHPAFLAWTTAGVIVGLLFLRNRFGILGPAIGLSGAAIVGIIGEFIFLRQKHGYRISTLFNSSDILSDIKVPYKAIALLMGSSFVVQSQGIIERSFVSTLSPGSVVSLSLALSVLGLPTSLLLPAATAVLLPHFSRQEYAGKGHKYGLTFRQYAAVALLFLLFVIGCWLFSDLLVNLLFLRGDFTTDAASLTSWTIRWLSISTLPYVIGTILRQVVLSRSLVIYEALVALSMLLIKIGLLTLLIPLFGYWAVVTVILIGSFYFALAYFFIIRYERAQRERIEV